MKLGRVSSVEYGDGVRRGVREGAFVDGRLRVEGDAISFLIFAQSTKRSKVRIEIRGNSM